VLQTKVKIGWIIEKDHIARYCEDAEETYLDGNIHGDYDPKESVAFKMYDDDRELYYSGRVTDNEYAEAQDALLNWGMHYAGCTILKVYRNHKLTQEIG